MPKLLVGNFKGPKGESGQKGKDGVSIAEVKQITTSTTSGGENVMEVVSDTGESLGTFSVRNGAKGEPGKPGEVEVESVNGKTGEVVLSADDVGALPTDGGIVKGDVRIVGEIIPKNINFIYAHSFVANKAGWYQFFESSYVGGNLGNSILLNINRTYNIHPNECYTVLVEHVFRKPRIFLLGASISTQLIDRIRVRYKNNEDIKIDFHYTSSHGNNVNVFGYGRGNFQDPVLLSDSIEEGWSTEEFILSSAVKSSTGFYVTDTYALLGTAGAGTTVQNLIDEEAKRIKALESGGSGGTGGGSGVSSLDLKIQDNRLYAGADAELLLLQNNRLYIKQG